MKRRSAGLASAALLTGGYRTGTSLLYRAPLALKAVVLVLLSAVVLASSSFVVQASAAVLVAGLYVLARMVRELWVPLRLMWPLLVLLAAVQVWMEGPAAAVLVTGRIVLCVVAARLLTLTTAPQELMDGLAALARPLTCLGADPERFALTLALMMRSLPFLLGSAGEVRQSAMARGLERNPRALAVPVVIRAVAYAHQTGEALAARGLGEPTPQQPSKRKHAGRQG
ncbi:energy-coupling factor transporter transmembrane protein EcfT [Arthrobacter sp. zg-Y40]|uniref:energy-coupling factor transporter transmembrane component T family protein n=1 Tax=Arthrobacter sp. zg-Y40 TaxID=2886939 RepID=UPI001D156E1B|nr:energy-coupling factor transporter transmembrane protein EcfT [Arthrobacter sp. zg-Y40]